MRKLTDHLFFIQDTCSVYGVTANDKTLLIDCGTSPTKLGANGVQQVDQVLLTHFPSGHLFRCISLEQGRRTDCSPVCGEAFLRGDRSPQGVLRHL